MLCPCRILRPSSARLRWAYKIYPFTLPHLTTVHLNTDPIEAPRKPCWRDMHNLTTTLLIPALVQLVPLKELKRRIQEINATHPHFREETPLVYSHEVRRRQRLSGRMEISASSIQVA